jgi:hypothetical protein
VDYFTAHDCKGITIITCSNLAIWYFRVHISGSVAEICWGTPLLLVHAISSQPRMQRRVSSSELPVRSSPTWNMKYVFNIRPNLWFHKRGLSALIYMTRPFTLSAHQRTSHPSPCCGLKHEIPTRHAQPFSISCILRFSFSSSCYPAFLPYRMAVTPLTSHIP